MKKKALLSIAALAAAAQALAVSPYISQVHDYHPAPGQFVNEIPEYESGDTYETILSKVHDQICGAPRPGMITLGAFGGYVTFSFDHPVANKPGEYDFRVNGNAIISDRDNRGGSCEPGIILVSADANGNGIPDDEWYEIKGSEYDNPATIHDYAITYFRPSTDHNPTPHPSDRHILDTRYIRWTDSNAAEGFLERNDQHLQSYWPLWLDPATESISFQGERLPSNATDINGDGSYFVLRMLGEGYADNYPSVASHGTIDPGVKIDWAVKADGTPANLSQIHFIRVYTAVNATCGWIGETSTEITGAEDLHPDYLSAPATAITSSSLVVLPSPSGTLSLRASHETPDAQLFSSSGTVAARLDIRPGDNRFELSHLPQGIYILSAPGSAPVKIAL